MEYFTTAEVCAYLDKSSKTIQRYVKQNVLHPELVKNTNGATAYRFLKNEIEDFKKTMSQTSPRPDNGVRPLPDMSVVSETLSRTVEVLTKQLEVKDTQIAELNERLRESNILLRNEQERAKLLPGQTGQKQVDNVQDTAFQRLFPTFYRFFKG